MLDFMTLVGHGYRGHRLGFGFRIYGSRYPGWWGGACTCWVRPLH